MTVCLLKLKKRLLGRYGNIQSAYAFYSILTIVMFVVLVGYNIISARKSKNNKLHATK